MVATQLALNGIIVGLQYALVAIGFSMIYSITRVLHIAQGAAYVLAAYSFYEVSQRLGLGVFLGIVAAIVSVGLFGVLMQEGVYRAIGTGREHNLFAVWAASFGVVVIVDNLISLAFGDAPVTTLPALATSVSLGGQLVVTWAGILGVGLTVGVVLGLYVVLKRTRIGVLLRALASSEDLFELTYGDARKYRLLAFVGGSVLVVPAALVIGSVLGVAPSDGINVGVILIAVTIVGGIGNLAGAALSGLALGLIENLAQLKLGIGWDPVITYSLIAVLMIVRPNGLLKPLRGE